MYKVFFVDHSLSLSQDCDIDVECFLAFLVDLNQLAKNNDDENMRKKAQFSNMIAESITCFKPGLLPKHQIITLFQALGSFRAIMSVIYCNKTIIIIIASTRDRVPPLYS